MHADIPHYEQILKEIVEAKSARDEDVLVIGDSLEVDLLVPLRLGMKVVLVGEAVLDYEKAFVEGHEGCAVQPTPWDVFPSEGSPTKPKAQPHRAAVKSIPGAPAASKLSQENPTLHRADVSFPDGDRREGGRSSCNLDVRARVTCRKIHESRLHVSPCGLGG